MKNNLMIAVAATLLVAGGGGFFAGMKYQQSKTPSFNGNFGEMRQRFGDQNGSGTRAGAPNGINAVRGEIISKDENSITIKLSDDSSKIVVLSDSTSINKTDAASADDLSEGTQVTIFGQTNSDGSVTANNIQIGDNNFRPMMPENQ